VSQQHETANTVNHYITELERAGIDAKAFAELARKILKGDAPSDEREQVVRPFTDDNVPGFEYVQRISSASGRALAAQVERMNGDWSTMREGRYTFAMAMQSWAQAVESYYSVLTEAWRGPSQMPRPAWLVLPYSQRKPPAPALSVRIDGIFDQKTALEYTRFEGLGKAQSTEDIYAEPPYGVSSRVEVRLNDDAIQQLEANTDHVGFIFRKGMGVAPPLVIVVLRVTA
jgi:hypothetical protein